MQPAEQPGDRCQRGVGLAPLRIGDLRHVAVDEQEAFASVPVDADGERGALEARVPHGLQEGVDRARVGTRGAKHVRSGADDVARVGDPTVERLLGHSATMADERVRCRWLGPVRPRQLGDEVGQVMQRAVEVVRLERRELDVLAQLRRDR